MDEVLGLVGGGKGETGEIPASGPARMGFSVGEGVGSGVVACMLTVGGEGASLCACVNRVSNQNSFSWNRAPVP